MTNRASTRRVRVTSAVLRAGWGGALLLVPRQMLDAAGYAPAPAAAVIALRMLGLRHLVQAAGGASVPALGAVVDTLHTASCLALAAGSRRWRRAALLDAAVESSLTTAAWVIAARRPAVRDR